MVDVLEDRRVLSTLSFSSSVPYQATDWNQTFQLPRFNPLLGTLNRVDISLKGNFSSDTSLENLGPAGTLNIALNGLVGLSSGPAIPVTGLVVLASSPPVSVSLPAFDGVDDFAGPSATTLPTQNFGGTNSLSTTLPGDLALFTGSGNVQFAGAAVGGFSSSGGGNSHVSVATTASAEVDLTYTYTSDPNISVVKLTNGTNNDAAPGVLIPIGGPVTWTYNVTTTGNAALGNVTVADNIPGVNPTPVLSGGFNVGDVNQDGFLESGETWVFTASGIAIAGQYNNIGTATGKTLDNQTVTATNPDNYFGYDPRTTTSTVIKDSGGGAVTGAFGESVYDTATVTSATPAPGVPIRGTVTYNFYQTSTPVYGTTVPFTTQTVVLNPNGTVPNSSVTSALAAGSYSYIAVFTPAPGSIYQGSVGDIEPLTINPPPPAAPALTWGYWKTHTGFGPQANAWPVGTVNVAPGVIYYGAVDGQGRASSRMFFGNRLYSFAEIQAILATPVGGDALLNLGHQLIAAILNVANGAGTPSAVSLIQQSSDLLATNGYIIGVSQVKQKTNPTRYAQLVSLASQLDAFNSSGV